MKMMMKLTYTERIVNRKNKNYTIVIPDNIDKFVNNHYMFDADRKGLEAIMLSALMMIKRQNIIVYFPLQKNIVPQGYFGGAEKLKRFECDKAMYDVVFINHTMQMPIGDWKEIRRTLNYVKGSKFHFNADVKSEYIACTESFARYKKTEKYYKRKDVFLDYIRFDTYFLVGGKFSFVQIFTDLKEMLELPLEENLKNGEMPDFVVFVNDCRKSGYDFTELGFFDDDLRELCRSRGKKSLWDWLN